MVTSFKALGERQRDYLVFLSQRRGVSLIAGCALFCFLAGILLLGMLLLGFPREKKEETIVVVLSIAYGYALSFFQMFLVYILLSRRLKAVMINIGETRP